MRTRSDFWFLLQVSLDHPDLLELEVSLDHKALRVSAVKLVSLDLVDSVVKLDLRARPGLRDNVESLVCKDPPDLLDRGDSLEHLEQQVQKTHASIT